MKLKSLTKNKLTSHYPAGLVLLAPRFLVLTKFTGLALEPTSSISKSPTLLPMTS